MGSHTIELANSLSDHWASWMGAAVVDSICLLLAVSAIWWLIRRRVAPNIGYALFLLVPLRLLSPIAIGVPHGVANWLPSQIAARWLNAGDKAPSALAKTKAEQPAVDTAQPLVDSASPQMHGESRPSREPQPFLPEATAPVAATTVPVAIVPPQTIHSTTIAMAVWLVVALLLVVRFVLAQGELRRWLRRAKEIDNPRLRELLRSLCEQAAIRKNVRLVESDRVAAPAAWGLLRPTIIVPPDFCASLGEKQLRWMLLHELAHLKRHDLPVMLLQRIAAILNFFNPAVWIANRAANRLREYACDDFATLVGASSGVEASEAFMQTLQNAYRTRQKLQGALGIFGLDMRGACFARLRRMLDTDRPMRAKIGWPTIAALAIVALVALPHLYAAPNSTTPPTAIEKSPQKTAANQSAESKPASRQSKNRNPDRTIPFSLSGHARRPDGKALAGIEIHLVTTYAYAAMPLVQVRSFIAKSGTDGSFKFNDVPIPMTPGGVEKNSPNVGGFMLWAAPPGYGFVWSGLRNYWNTDDSGANQGPGIVHKRQGAVDFYRDKRVNVDLDFVPATALHGRVVDEDDKPVADADVSLWGADYLDGSGKALHENYREFAGMQQLMKRELRSARTDADGRFSIGGLQPEICFGVEIECKGFADSSFYAATTDRPITEHRFSETTAAVQRGRKWVELSQPGSHPARPNGFTVILQRPHRVLIDVVAADTGKPLENVAMHSEWQGEGPSGFGKSDSKGRAILNLPPGQYTLTAEPPNNSLYVATQAELNGTADRDREPFRFVMTRGCETTLEAIDAATGKGIPGVSFHVLDLMPPFKPNVVGSGDKPSFLQESMHRPLDWRKTDVTGRMQVVLPPGTFSFEACGLDYEAADSTTPTTLPSGGNAMVQFKLKAMPAAATEPKKKSANGDQLSDAGRKSAPSETETKGRSKELQVFTLTVVGPDKKPLPGITVDFRSHPAVKRKQFLSGKIVKQNGYQFFVQLDEHGQMTARVPKNPQWMDIFIEPPGYGPYWAKWRSSNHPDPVAPELTAELDPAWSVGGVLVDESGKPVDGAIVQPSTRFKKRPGQKWEDVACHETKTNAKGEWRFDSVSDYADDVSITVSDPRFAELGVVLSRSQYEIKRGSAPTARIELPRGVTVSGTVTDDAGHPIAGATVRTKYLNDVREAKSGADGKYRLAKCHAGPARVVVSAKGKATDMQELTLSANMPPVDFQMRPGGIVRIRVLDSMGKPVPNAVIFFQRWRGRFQYFEFDDQNEYADKNGAWQWNEAPLDEFAADICDGRSKMQLTLQRLIARKEEYVFRLPAVPVISGNVVDAETRKPIKDFHVEEGVDFKSGGLQWPHQYSFPSTDGHFEIRIEREDRGYFVRVSADGYETATSRKVEWSEGNVALNFELHKRESVK